MQPKSFNFQDPISIDTPKVQSSLTHTQEAQSSLTHTLEANLYYNQPKSHINFHLLKVNLH